MERTQGPLRNRFRQRECIAPLKIDMMMPQRREPCHIHGLHGDALGAYMLQRGFHVEGVPQDDYIDHQPERPELIFLAFPVPLPELAPLPMKDRTRDTMAPFPSVELRADAPAIVLVINV